MNLTFAALADPTRRAILARLADDATADGLQVTALAAPFRDAMSLPAVSKHLRVLERAGLLVQQKDGRVRRCQLRPEPLADAAAWIAHYRRFWADRLDALADWVERPTHPDTNPPPETP